MNWTQALPMNSQTLRYFETFFVIDIGLAEVQEALFLHLAADTACHWMQWIYRWLIVINSG